MIKYCSQIMTKMLVKNNVICAEEDRIYEYGFETFLASLINITTVLIIGVISGRLIHTLLFLISYSSVRQFSGGYHAKSHKRCFLIFLGITLSTLILIKHMVLFESPLFLIIILSISLGIIFRLAPLEHCNNPLNKFEKTRYKHIARGLSLALGAVALLGLFIPYVYQYSLYIVFALLWVGIMLVGGYRKEGNK